MNELKRFNAALDYIEGELQGEIDFDKLGQIALCPASLFSRIFSVFSNMPLGEYIRQRRLSRAAVELQTSGRKVIDVALDYGYESVDAFTAAFRRFHHKTPSEVKKGQAFQVLPPIHFSLHIEGGMYMDVRIEKKPAFKVAGLSIAGQAGADFAKLWDELFDKVPMDQLVSLGSGQSYGSCYDYEASAPEAFRYLAGFDCTDVAKAKALGLELLEVPQASYAVVKVTGPIPGSIQSGWKYMMGSFLPQHGYSHITAPDFEVYSEGDMTAEDYTMDLWVPIEN